MRQKYTIELSQLGKVSIITQFQPIISVKNKTIVGVEALSRGISEKTGEIVAPLALFKAAADSMDDLIKLDRLCRESALTNYKKIRKIHKNMLLFINIESSILDCVRQSNYLIERVNDIGLNPCDLVLEINESKIDNIDALICFVNRYREYGFIIALDDVGAGFSNLNRIPLLNPDIIKIDRYILSNIDADHHKKEVIRALVGLASNTGALVVAEGIETSGEAMLASELCADMMQGYFFSRPLSELSCEEINQNLTDFIKSYKASMNQKGAMKKLLIKKLNDISEKILEMLTGQSRLSIEKALKKIIATEDDIECMYVLNEDGIQTSKTVFRPKFRTKNKSVLFLPADKGTDHSLKGYYYHLVNNSNKNYISHKYLSMATGNMCITLSAVFYNDIGEKSILCIDFLADSPDAECCD